MSNDDMFNQPAQGGGYFEAKEAVGHLILITKVHEVYHNPTNVYGGKPAPRDEARVDVVDLNAPGQDLRERIIMTHPGLVNRLTTGATNILGRIGQIPTDKGNPAFVLNGHEPADVAMARNWVEMYQASQFASPGQAPAQGAQMPAQAPQTAPVAQAPQVPAPAPQAAPQVDQAQLLAMLAQLQGTGQAAPQQFTQDPPF